jgi:hypothetical protein
MGGIIPYMMENIKKKVWNYQPDYLLVKHALPDFNPWKSVIYNWFITDVTVLKPESFR